MELYKVNIGGVYTLNEFQLSNEIMLVEKIRNLPRFNYHSCLLFVRRLEVRLGHSSVKVMPRYDEEASDRFAAVGLAKSMLEKIRAINKEVIYTSSYKQLKEWFFETFKIKQTKESKRYGKFYSVNSVDVGTMLLLSWLLTNTSYHSVYVTVENEEFYQQWSESFQKLKILIEKLSEDDGLSTLDLIIESKKYDGKTIPTFKQEELDYEPEFEDVVLKQKQIERMNALLGGEYE